MIEVRLGTPVLGADSAKFAKFCRELLDGLILANLETFRAVKFPPLYRSGVRFENEPAGTESFVDAWIVRAKGYGDCAHLCAWRIAELRLFGEHATASITWRPGTKNFHVQVRRAAGKRGLRHRQCSVCDRLLPERSLEDPSHLLGMSNQWLSPSYH